MELNYPRSEKEVTTQRNLPILYVQLNPGLDRVA